MKVKQADMKKRTIAVMAGCLPDITDQGSTRQQELVKPFAHLHHKIQIPFSYNESSGSIPVADPPLIITTAKRNFKKRCAMATNEHWVVTSDCCMVEFINDHTLNQINFDREGNPLHRIKYYGEDKLDPETRKMIKRCYSGLSVTVVTEICKKGATIYFIQLENKTRLMKLRISNSEWDVMENYAKN
jgi:hypothetical protein